MHPHPGDFHLHEAGRGASLSRVMRRLGPLGLLLLLLLLSLLLLGELTQRGVSSLNHSHTLLSQVGVP